ncbi:hypothetical protein BDR05DRAFT_964582 [Suillus weaverae]|nr:hypothetical protein BDR05DRAFT_964582 [Suillus weaverae]
MSSNTVFLSHIQTFQTVYHASSITIVDLVVVQIYHTFLLIRFFIPVLTFNYSYPSLKCNMMPGKVLKSSYT